MAGLMQPFLNENLKIFFNDYALPTKTIIEMTM
mgnify:CR=1 FL=1